METWGRQRERPSDTIRSGSYDNRYAQMFYLLLRTVRLWTYPLRTRHHPEPAQRPVVLRWLLAPFAFLLVVLRVHNSRRTHLLFLRDQIP